MTYILAKGTIIHFQTDDIEELKKKFNDAQIGYVQSGERPQVKPYIWQQINPVTL